MFLDFRGDFRLEAEAAHKLEQLKGELFGREVPPQYRELIRKTSFMMGPDPFSNYLAEAVSRQPFFRQDEFLRTQMVPLPEVSLALQDSNLNPFGRELRARTLSADAYDMGCGDPRSLKVPRMVSSAFGAARYIGVDKEMREHVKTGGEFPELGRCDEFYLSDDMLAFVSKIEKLRNKAIFFVSGIEPVNSSDWESGYLDCWLEEVRRLAESGGQKVSIVQGKGTHAFFPEKHGFRKIEQQGIQILYDSEVPSLA